jgi:hypothetical protein
MGTSFNEFPSKVNILPKIFLPYRFNVPSLLWYNGYILKGERDPSTAHHLMVNTGSAAFVAHRFNVQACSDTMRMPAHG